MRVKMLERDNDWGRVRVLQMIGILVSIVSGISMALLGAGVYALVVPGLLGSTVFLIELFLFSGWRPHWQWDYASYRDTLHFGLNRAGSNALNGGRELIQNGLITQHLQFSSLGLFGRAQGLANMFCGRVAQEVGGALYPVITRVEEGSVRFQKIGGLVLQSVSWVVFPVAMFFSLHAENLIRLIYGHKWLSVIPLLPMSMAIGVAVSIGSTAYRILLANNQTRLCLRSDIAAFVMATAVMAILIPQGLIIYLAGATLVSVAIATILLTLLLRTGGISGTSIFIALFPPLVASAFAGGLSWAVTKQLPADLLPIFKVVPAAAVFATVYVMTLRVFFLSHLATMMEYLPGSKRLARLLCI
jgi:teichuronic acid exporter